MVGKCLSLTKLNGRENFVNLTILIDWIKFEFDKVSLKIVRLRTSPKEQVVLNVNTLSKRNGFPVKQNRHDQSCLEDT